MERHYRAPPITQTHGTKNRYHSHVPSQSVPGCGFNQTAIRNHGSQNKTLVERSDMWTRSS
jgi:hypothetical protein